MLEDQRWIAEGAWQSLAFSRAVARERSATTQATAMRLLRNIVAVVLVILVNGCTPPAQTPSSQPIVPIAIQPISTTFDPAHTPGPTHMAKVAEGYELTNTLYRVVIDDQTGDVIFWGFVDQSRNMVFHRGIYTTLTNLPDAPIHDGYIEKRDEQTWQFFGEDDNRITWRKIYCLQGDSLFVSVMVANSRAEPVTTAIQINGELISLHIEHHDSEMFSGSGGYGSIELRGFNEIHSPASQPALPTLLQSDTFGLKPGERQGYTSQWKILPAGEN
jgi:hypothetical protein